MGRGSPPRPALQSPLFMPKGRGRYAWSSQFPISQFPNFETNNQTENYQEEEMPPPPAAVRRYRIGYAFPPKKQQSFIQPSLVDHASQNGIDLVPISVTDFNSNSTNTSKGGLGLSLSQQGPFDCIIHKLYGPQWNQQLKEYSSQYPATLILDPPESIERLHNRVSMLDVVTALNLKSIGKFNFKISVPKQVVIQQRPQAAAGDDIGNGLEFPMIAKSLLANGSAKSHEMCLVFDSKGLQSHLLSDTTTLPILLQQFVNHGGVIFKVYVIGEYVQCVKRRSLPDISEQQMSTLAGFALPFSQISNSPLDEQNLALAHDPHEMPPSDFVEELARGIRLGLKLNFFNFDVIRDSSDPLSYYVIDINYFPGFAKLPSYERVLTDFLLSLLSNPQNQEDQKEDQKDQKEMQEAATKHTTTTTTQCTQCTREEEEVPANDQDRTTT